MQAYLFSKPLPADDFAQLLQQGASVFDMAPGLSAEK
jgi:hypothetical protein